MATFHLIAIVAALCVITCTALAVASDDAFARVPQGRWPAFREGERILFQGDSITDGNRGRNEDPNHVLGHGYVFLIGADAGAGVPERGLTFLNRGISGNRVADLAKRWQADTIDLRPTLLSILIGVNDLNGGVPLDEFERGYDELLARTVQALPNTRLVLCEPFALPVGKKKDGWEAYRAQLIERQQAVARLATKYGATLVHFQRAFDEATQRAPAETWIWDGIHPTYAGHRIMADAWLRAVNDATAPSASTRPTGTP